MCLPSNRREFFFNEPIVKLCFFFFLLASILFLSKQSHSFVIKDTWYKNVLFITYPVVQAYRRGMVTFEMLIRGNFQNMKDLI